MLVKLETNDMNCVVESSQIKNICWEKTISYEVDEKADGSVEIEDTPELIYSRLEFITGGFIQVLGTPVEIRVQIWKQENSPTTEVSGE